MVLMVLILARRTRGRENEVIVKKNGGRTVEDGEDGGVGVDGNSEGEIL